MLPVPERRRSKSTQGSPRNLTSDPLHELEAMQYAFIPLPPSNVHGSHLVEIGMHRLLVSVSLNGEVFILKWDEKKVEIVGKGDIFEDAGAGQCGEVSCSAVIKSSDGSIIISVGSAESATITARDKCRRTGSIHFAHFHFVNDVDRWPQSIRKVTRVSLDRRRGVPVFLMPDWINEPVNTVPRVQMPTVPPPDATGRRRRSGLVNTLPTLTDASPELERAKPADGAIENIRQEPKRVGAIQEMGAIMQLGLRCKKNITVPPESPKPSSEQVDEKEAARKSLVVFFNEISDDREVYRAALYSSTLYPDGDMSWTSSQDVGKAWSMIFTGSNKVGAPTASDWTVGEGVIERLLVLGHHTGVVQAFWCPVGSGDSTSPPVVTCEDTNGADVSRETGILQVALETPVSAVKTRTFIEGSIGEAIFTLVAPALGPVRIYSIEAEGSSSLKMTTVFVTSPPESHDVLLSAYWNLVPHNGDEADHRMVMWLGHFGKVIVKYEEWPGQKLNPSGHYYLPSGAFAILPCEQSRDEKEEMVLVRSYHDVHLLGFAKE